MLALSTLRTSSPIWALYVAYLPMMAGMAVTMSPLTTLIMSSVPSSRAGIGSAMNDTTRELGGALGVAVLGSLLATRFGSAIGPAVAGLSPEDAATATTGLAGALEVADHVPGGAGPPLAEAARAAYVRGMSAATLLAAVVVAFAAASAARLLPGPAPAIPEAGASPPPVAIED